MKMKIAYPDDVLTAHEVDLIGSSLRKGLLEAVARNFPNWRERIQARNISGGEIILQKADMTEPIVGLNDGIHLTISLISFKPERDFAGLAEDLMHLISETRSEDGDFIMDNVGVFVQMSLDCPVEKDQATGRYYASPTGRTLLEFPE